MRQTKIFRIAVGVALIALLLPPLGAQDEAVVRRLLVRVRRDALGDDWAGAVRELRAMGGVPAEKLDRELARLLVRRQKDLDRVVGQVEGLADTREDGKIEAARLRFEEARAEARDFIFDETRFPPATGGVPLISEGYETARTRGNAAVRAFGEIEEHIRRAAGGGLRLSAADASKLKRSYEEALGRYRRVAAEIEDAGETPLPGPVSLLVLDLHAGDLPALRARCLELEPGFPRLLGFYLYSEAILLANAKAEKALSGRTLMGMRELNRYRMALGHSPLILNEKLGRAAIGHSEEMRALAYFSHDSPTPERRTEGDRARLEGYEAGVAENIYAAPSMIDAIPVWKMSAKHHRTMTTAMYPEAGVGAAGPVTLLLGSGETGVPPCLVY